MISYIVGRNFGHLNRCIASVSKFQQLSNELVKIYTFPHSFEWIESNLPYVTIDKFNKNEFKNELFQSNLIIHDWRDEVFKIKEIRGNHDFIMSGIYHSDIILSEHDPVNQREFKREIQVVAEKTTDIFFHINFMQPVETPNLSTFYVPIPPVSREITQEPAQVKEILGIPPNESFILIQMGGGMKPSRYKHIKEWFEKINKLCCPHRIVIANQFKKISFPFNKNIIQAPLFYNGINLVNAAEIVVSKPGMGILVDCVTTGTPLLSLPADTEEREEKNLTLKKLIGNDFCIVPEKFTHIELAERIMEILDHSKVFKDAFNNLPHNGADVLAKVMKMLSGESVKNLPDLHDEILKLTPFAVK